MRATEVSARRQIIGKADLVGLGDPEAAEQLDSHLLERPEVKVMAAAMAGGDYVSNQPSCGSGERRGCAVEESRLRCPPDDVATADPPRAPRAPAARDEYLAARFVELLRELAARLAAADDEHRAGGKSSWIRVFLSQ